MLAQYSNDHIRYTEIVYSLLLRSHFLISVSFASTKDTVALSKQKQDKTQLSTALGAFIMIYVRKE